MKTLVAVIAYNEKENIKHVIEDLQKNSEYDVVVIDNSSTDTTAEVCRKLKVNVISHSINTGGSFGTVTTYFQYAYRKNYDILCQFDGDGQHMASELCKIVKPIKSGQADYIIGSRFLERKGFQSYFLRRIGIRLFAFLDSVIAGQKITDSTSGFRAYNRNVIEFFVKYYKHELHDTNQMLLLSHFAGAKILEVPVEMRSRQHGKSEYNFINAVTFPFKGIVNILGCLLQKKQIKAYMRKNGN